MCCLMGWISTALRPIKAVLTRISGVWDIGTLNRSATRYLYLYVAPRVGYEDTVLSNTAQVIASQQLDPEFDAQQQQSAGRRPDDGQCDGQQHDPHPSRSLRADVGSHLSGYWAKKLRSVRTSITMVPIQQIRSRSRCRCRLGLGFTSYLHQDSTSGILDGGVSRSQLRLPHAEALCDLAKRHPRQRSGHDGPCKST